MFLTYELKLHPILFLHVLSYFQLSLDDVAPRLSCFIPHTPMRLSSGVTIIYLLGCDIRAHGRMRCQNLALRLHGYIS